MKYRSKEPEIQKVFFISEILLTSIPFKIGNYDE